MRPPTRPMRALPIQLLQACDRARQRGVPFTASSDPRHPIMRQLEQMGAVRGTRRGGKTFWTITTDGDTMLANARAQAARALAETVRHAREAT